MFTKGKTIHLLYFFVVASLNILIMLALLLSFKTELICRFLSETNCLLTNLLLSLISVIILKKSCNFKNTALHLKQILAKITPEIIY